MEVHFRNMKPNDVDEIIDVHKKSVYGLCKDFYSQEQMSIWTSLFSQKFSNEGIKDSNNIGIVAIEAGKVVGYGFINLQDKEVKGMYLTPEVRGKGVGRSILFKLESIAKENKLNELVLNSTLNAVAFYEKCGYAKLRDEVFTLTESCKIPCVHMVRKFNSE